MDESTGLEPVTGSGGARLFNSGPPSSSLVLIHALRYTAAVHFLERVRPDHSRLLARPSDRVK